MDTSDIDMLAQSILDENQEPKSKASLIEGIKQNRAIGFLTDAINAYALNKAVATGQTVLVTSVSAAIDQLVKKLKQQLGIT